MDFPARTPHSDYLESYISGMNILYPQDWKSSMFDSGVIVSPQQDGNTSMYITAINVPGGDLNGFADSEIEQFQKATTGSFDIDRISMCCDQLISNNPAMTLHFIYSDSTFKTYIYEHQKTYVKHGDRIYIFDYAADSNQSYRKYLDTINNIISLSLSTAS